MHFTGLLLLLGLAPVLLGAQPSAPSETSVSGDPGAWDASVQLGYFPLGGGGTTARSMSTIAYSARVAVRLSGRPRRNALEGYVQYAPRETVPSAKPQLTLAGMVIRRSFGRNLVDGVNATLSIGVGWMRVVVDEIPCGVGCLNEGGANFRSGEFGTLTFGAGILAPVVGRSGLRVDARAFVPVMGSSGAGDSTKPRLELAAGVQVGR